MDQMLGILCVLGFVLMIVVVIGHGLWLLGAAVLRAILPASPTTEGRPMRNLRQSPWRGWFCMQGLRRVRRERGVSTRADGLARRQAASWFGCWRRGQISTEQHLHLSRTLKNSSTN